MRSAHPLIACVLLLAGSAAARAASPPHVVASFSILGDLVRQVGRDRVVVDVLVGPGGDAHVFSPSPADAQKVAGATLVVVNGLGLEGWFGRLVEASGTRAPVVVASRAVKPIAGTGEDAGKNDPHAWQDVRNARLYVEAIRAGLCSVDAPGCGAYTANAAAYGAELDALDAEVRAAMAAIPPGRRRIITTHDAFGYFEHSYGITVLAPQGVSTEADASARDVATIIRQVKAEKVPAVFLENVSDERLMRRIASETGAAIGGTVYSDALSPPDGPAATYVAMIRNNVAAFVKALAR
jgi:zinc/manganese transport system substrate-binding protein